MKITAIICEYNPMTNGHVRHLEVARAETNADTILCVMSGSFVQRGEAAIADKYVRAEAACKAGADIVVELPTLYAISPADNFAYGAVKTISAFPGVEYISFGSECGDIEKLNRVADFLSCEPEEFKIYLKVHLAEGYSYPKARSLALLDYATRHSDYADVGDILDKPNNVLGISYIIAAKKAGLGLKFHTIKREDNFNSTDMNMPCPSATAVREAVHKKDFEHIASSVPQVVYDYIVKLKPNDTSLGDMILFKIKTMNGFDLAKYYDVNGGIHNRLKLAAVDSNSYEAMLEKAKTKKYTMAHLKRICLYALFDITQDFYNESVDLPPYVQILALRNDRKDILSELSAVCPNIVTRYGEISKADKRLRPMLKLDFSTQGILDIINRSNDYNRKMVLVDCNLQK